MNKFTDKLKSSIDKLRIYRTQSITVQLSKAFDDIIEVFIYIYEDIVGKKEKK